MDESKLKKIAANCKKATYLIEKNQIGVLNKRETLELKIHLAGCSECRIFEHQSIVINKLVNDLFHEPKIEEFKLDDEFKKEMQDRVDKSLR